MEKVFTESKYCYIIHLHGFTATAASAGFTPDTTAPVTKDPKTARKSLRSGILAHPRSPALFDGCTEHRADRCDSCTEHRADRCDKWPRWTGVNALAVDAKTRAIFSEMRIRVTMVRLISGTKINCGLNGDGFSGFQ